MKSLLNKVLLFVTLAVLPTAAQFTQIPSGGGSGSSPEVEVDITSDLVNHWAMENDSCTTDAGSGADNITLTGSPTCQTAGGAVGDDYLELNGSTQYGTADITWPTADFTFAHWIKADDGNARFLWAGHDGSSSSAELGIQIPADPAENFAVNYNQLSAVISVPNVAMGVWMHWALTREDGIMRAWVNGELVGTSIALDTLSFSTCDFLLGFESDSGCAGSQGNFWDGGIDDVRIYHRALSSVDIAALHALGN